MLIIGGGATHRDDEKGEKRRKDTRKIEERAQTMLIIRRFPGILELGSSHDAFAFANPGFLIF